MRHEAGSREVSPDSVRTEVERILSSEGFARSERLSRFLRFTVEQALLGKADGLKEYLIGLEVFDKDESFDPRLDTGVRVEARRLRTALLTYYATVGQNDPIRIEYPKGSYAPVFQVQRPPEPIPLAKSWRRLVPYVVVLAAGVGLTYWWTAGRRAPARPTEAVSNPLTSVAVLPFADMSPQKDQEYFCDGLTEELIHTLTKVEGLRVVARTSSFQFKGQGADIRIVGQRLKVGVVLEGSVRKEDDKLKITAQLNSAADGYHLWSETYERRLRDVFAVQGEIAAAVARTLKMSLASNLDPLHDEGGTEDVEAHNLYLKGRYFWKKWTDADRRKSIPYFEQAIAKDPRYALAYVGLADAYGVLGVYGAMRPEEGDARRKAYLAKAFELTDQLSEAYTSRAMSKAAYDRDYSGAEQDSRRAIELNPKDPEAHSRFATTLFDWRRFHESRRELETAQRLDPLSVAIAAYLARVSYLLREYDRAIEEANAALEMDASYPFTYDYLGLSYVQKKMYPEAIATFQKGVTADESPGPRMNLAYAYAMAGRTADAESVLTKVVRNPRQVPLGAAKVYMALGQTERALGVLEQSYDRRLGRLVTINIDPLYDPLRSQPRFQNLLKKLALPPGE